MAQVSIDTPLGIATVFGDQSGITAIHVQDIGDVSDEIPTELLTAVNQLNEYFSGLRTAFDLPIKPKGTPFQQKVWKALCEIPFGKTISYLDLAKQLGDPKAIRAVASANGKNPLWIIIPCHRVIGSDGSLTGYAGGLRRKEWLLRHECPMKQQKLFE